MQETLDGSDAMHDEKDNRISTLEQQLYTLTQSNEDMSNNSQAIAEQMIELRNAVDDRNQRISHLELNLSEMSEERELLKSEMANQTQELLNQVKDLRAQLEEVRLLRLFY
jgi:chromosome segregation ATPase